MDFDTVAKAGSRLGTGGIVVFDEQTCMVGATLNMIRFYARESCGWCTPCREGLPFVVDVLERIETGQGELASFGRFYPLKGQRFFAIWSLISSSKYCKSPVTGPIAPGARGQKEKLKYFTCSRRIADISRFSLTGFDPFQDILPQMGALPGRECTSRKIRGHRNGSG